MERVYRIENILTNKEGNPCNNKYHGEIIVDENGWFEGYIEDETETIYKDEKKQFIFGIFHPGEILDLYLCSNLKRPEVFHGKLENNNFKGKIYTFIYKDEDYELNFKEYFENLEYHNITFSKSDADINKIKGSILYLKSKLNGACPYFYNKAYENRKDLNEILVKSYVGIPFSKEDIIKGKKLKNKKREVRQMVKTLTPDYL